jgi:uncharacterized protein YrrD
MQFKEKADVLTSDGRKLGRIDRVVINPGTEEITHLVVKKGLLLTRDKVVPIDQISTTTEHQVVLKKRTTVPDEFPDFEETQYIPVGGVEEFRQRESEQAQRVIWYHTRINIPWWREAPSLRPLKPLFIKKTQRNIPEDTIPLEEGAKVIDTGGEPVGEIEEVYAETEEHRVTHLLISRGAFTKEKKLIPSAWVKDIFEGSVRLSVERKVIENLPQAASSNDA